MRLVGLGGWEVGRFLGVRILPTTVSRRVEPSVGVGVGCGGVGWGGVGGYTEAKRSICPTMVLMFLAEIR